MRGVSLIESVVTLGVVMLLITGLVVGTTSSLQNSQRSKARELAVQSAQEALEIMRRERDFNWDTFAQKGTIAGVEYCMGEDGVLGSSGSCTRKITCTLIDPEQMDITVSVYWIEGSSTKNVSLKTTLTKWK